MRIQLLPRAGARSKQYGHGQPVIGRLGVTVLVRVCDGSGSQYVISVPPLRQSRIDINIAQS